MRTFFISLALAVLTLPAAARDITAADVLSSMNIYRAENGLPPLREDSRLDLAACDRMRDMGDLSYWSHESPDGRSPFLWLKPRGYVYRYAGENLAAGFETTEVLVTAWMESEGHRENILSPRFDDCGIAVIEGSTKGPASGKSIVVMFGREGM
ncbi:MAG: CAP domain-containing protein [Thermoanaerobaculia bacterium]